MHPRYIGGAYFYYIDNRFPIYSIIEKDLSLLKLFCSPDVIYISFSLVMKTTSKSLYFFWYSIAFSIPITNNDVESASAFMPLSDITDTDARLLFTG